MKMRRTLHRLALAAMLAGAAAAPTRAADAPKKCRYARVGSIPVEWKNSQLLMNGAINDHPARLLVDSGAQRMAVMRAGAERLALPLNHSSTGMTGVSGDSVTYETRLDTITFGPAVWRSARMPVLWDVAVGVDVDALVAADFLFQRDVELSPAEGRMNFFVPENCDDAPLGYWAKDVPSVDMKASAPGDPRKIVEVVISGKTFRAMIDTGADATVIDLAAARKIGFDPNAPGVVRSATAGIGTHQNTAWITTLPALELGPERITNFPVMVADLWGSAVQDAHSMNAARWADAQAEMLLGADFLQQHRLLFASSQQQLYFSYLGPLAVKADAR